MPSSADSVGDLAIVLHSHMPYVEGFGTYPFGEEWLFEAVLSSYLPVLEVARSLTLTVTPVLADQLDADGVADRLTAWATEFRLGTAETDAREASAELQAPARVLAARYRRALARLEELDGDLLRAFTDAARDRDLAVIGSTATHSVLPLLATRAGKRLQIDAGLRSHRRRFGPSDGFWLPECAYRPGIEALLAERGVRFFCTDQSRHEDATQALAPIEAGNGLVAFPLHWPAIERVWGAAGYPSDPAYQEYHRQSLAGMRLWSIGGEPYDAAAASARAAAQADDFLAYVADALGEFEARRGRRGLLVFAIDTELLGTWWTEGPQWLAGVIERAAASGLRLLTLPQALAEHEPEARSMIESTWGEGKDLQTWDSPAVTDLTWASRGLELRLLRELDRGLEPDSAIRAARELLATQASDWAFLDSRAQAGEYAFGRAVDHSRALLEALDSRAPSDPRMRNLAPDISLAPLLEP